MRFEQPDLHLLRVLLTVVECGSFRAAQSHLGCRASAISMNIKKLETRLGFSVCQRGRSGLRLTPRGEVVVEAARRFVGAANDYNVAIARARERAFGEVKICVCDALQSSSSFSLSAILDTYVKTYPSIQLSVDILDPTEIERRVLDSGYDIGIAPSFHSFDGLLYDPLMGETNILVCAKGHRLFDKTMECSLEELTDVPSLFRDYLTQTSRKSIPFRGRITAHVNSIEAAMLLIRSGAYVGYLPEHVARSLIAKGELRELTSEARYTSTISAIYKKNHLSVEIRRLISCIVSATRNPDAGRTDPMER
ncbi:LysR family transcriptional regulator [Acetobacter sp. TBRC 12305]|uniref:LysR family transcriptional regulator n=1 Tax=Acetobacter garciniae TaxID=2817435 RepID=A0A939KQN2_9PROT|nr:LysR family transcriptional regulator [Acetobacter garciniae]MBO1325572.1 LysR family transcriptional regulator [Acetobacter garciniae]MBX0345255.1 LysR family transcriptional regulator [Acetobacter garciniae]